MKKKFKKCMTHTSNLKFLRQRIFIPRKYPELKMKNK